MSYPLKSSLSSSFWKGLAANDLSAAPPTTGNARVRTTSRKPLVISPGILDTLVERSLSSPEIWYTSRHRDYNITKVYSTL